LSHLADTTDVEIIIKLIIVYDTIYLTWDR
jgi:hypothetical protein